MKEADIKQIMIARHEAIRIGRRHGTQHRQVIAIAADGIGRCGGYHDLRDLPQERRARL